MIIVLLNLNELIRIIANEPSLSLDPLSWRCQWVVAMSSLNASVGVR